jgi:phenylalanyl-tRNA synthetase alpha chain
VPELHRLERGLLKALREERRLSLSELQERTKLEEAAVMKAALWLSSKGLASIEEDRRAYVELGSEGHIFLKKKMPERRLIEALMRLGGKAPFNNVCREAVFDEKEGTIALGWAKRKGWVTIARTDGDLWLTVAEEPVEGADEKLIRFLSNDKVLVQRVPEELSSALNLMKNRPNALNFSEEIHRAVRLTERGLDVAKTLEEEVEEISQLTPELIASGRWRTVRLRRFDVTAPGPVCHVGKIHPIQQIIQQIREIFLAMGFEEIRGPIIELAFWNFDALYQPQDHPARDMQDTFYLSSPSTGDLPDREIVEAVGKTHEDGWKTGSTGWGYRWDPREAGRLLLRTHTTVDTLKHLVDHKTPPVKIFSVDRTYRNEKVDYKHLAEFHQIEGVIMDRKVTLRDLMGALSEFYRRLGLEKVQFWPSFFPYTEPSVQSTVYVESLGKWVELCGMGVFRPEVTEPLGVKYPVLAWGGGLERVAMLKLAVDDMRQLYRNDLGWIRRIPACL